MAGNLFQGRQPGAEGSLARATEPDSGANIYQAPAWLHAICATGGYKDASRPYETAAGEQLVLPMIRRAWLPRALRPAGAGTRVTVLPSRATNR